MPELDIREMSDEQLVHRELQAERELIEARFRLHTNQATDSSVLGKLRKEIARCRTEERRREIQASLPKDSLRSRNRSSFVPGRVGVEAEKPGGGFLKGIVDRISGKE